MMEVYSIFREVVAQERVARDQTIRMGTVSEQLTAMQNKLNYVDSALGVLVKHLLKAEGPATAEKKVSFSTGHGRDFPGDFQVLGSGITINKKT
jgi:hypothetical protein